MPQNDRTLLTARSAMRIDIPDQRVVADNSCITTVSDAKTPLVIDVITALYPSQGVSEIS